MNHGRFIKIGYELFPIPKQRVDGKIWLENSRWAVPNEKHAKKALQHFRTSHEIPTSWAEDLSHVLKEKYSYTAIRDMYDHMLGTQLGVR